MFSSSSNPTVSRRSYLTPHVHIDLSEYLFGFGIVRVFIGVVFLCEFVIGLFNLFDGGCFGQAEDILLVSEGTVVASLVG